MKNYTIFIKKEDNMIHKLIEVKSKGLKNIILKELYKIYDKNTLIITESVTKQKGYNRIDFYNKYQNKIIK